MTLKKRSLLPSVIVITAIGLIFPFYANRSLAASYSVSVSSASRSGTISRNETWSGVITITGSIYVPKNVTLTLKPGTTTASSSSWKYWMIKSLFS